MTADTHSPAQDEDRDADTHPPASLLDHLETAAVGELAQVGSTVTLFAETAPGPGTGPKEPDYLVSVTLNTNLTAEERGYAVRMLLSALGEAADGDAAHIQMTVKITAPGPARDRIIERARQAGAQQATCSEL